MAARRKLAATSRDPEEWSAATAEARASRETTAAELAGTVADQLYDLLVLGDIMGGRTLATSRISEVVEAERRGDPEALRSAVMNAAAGFGAWAASLDHAAAQAAA